MTEAILNVQGTGVAVRGNDIDTDRIIPARYMKEVTFDNMGKFAFYDVCYDAEGNKKDHPFVDERYKDASILVVNKNFGCGSSREHAPQALTRWGIKAIVGESFAEIFAGNCTMLGIPVFMLSEEQIEQIMKTVEKDPSVSLSLDVENAELTVGETKYQATMNPSAQSALTQGTWDSTALLMGNIDKVKEKSEALPY